MTSYPATLDVGSQPLSLQVSYRAEAPYTGMWYGIAGFYRGASATFPSNMQPMAVYDAVSDRTFFTFANGYWPASVVAGYFDHARGVIGGVSRIIDLPDADGHRNPTIHIDAAGHVYVFANGKSSPIWVRKSRYPRDLSAWDWAASVPGQNTYSQPHALTPGEITVFYRPTPGYGWAYRRSANGGASWGGETVVVAPANPAIDGVYALTASRGASVHMVWTVLDSQKQLRRHLWHAQSSGGAAWAKADGTPLSLPIDARTGAERVFDSGEDQVNTQDLALDPAGNPLVLVSHGQIGGAWRFKLVKRKSGAWQAFDIGALGDRQFDCGGLIVDSADRLRALLPTGPGGIAKEDGGQIEEWLSEDAGESWSLSRTLTADTFNNNHVKVVRDGRPGFRAFWSYGDPRSGSGALVRFWDETRGVDLMRAGDPFARTLAGTVNGKPIVPQTVSAVQPVAVELDSSGARLVV